MKRPYSDTEHPIEKQCRVQYYSRERISNNYKFKDYNEEVTQYFSNCRKAGWPWIKRDVVVLYTWPSAEKELEVARIARDGNSAQHVMDES